MNYLTPEQEKLFNENHSLVYFVLKERLGTYNINDLDDICVAGEVGLMIACKQYDASKGAAFSTFAVPVIFTKMFSERRKLYRQRKNTVHLEDGVVSSKVPNHTGLTNLTVEDLEGFGGSTLVSTDLHSTVENRDMLNRINCLKDRWRNVAILTMKGYNGAEIGRMMGVSRELIRAYLNKIRHFLEAPVDELRDNMRKNSIYNQVPKY